MTGYQHLKTWGISFLFICLLKGSSFGVFCCHPTSKELHICLNIYLERDLPLVETIVKGQRRIGRYGAGRILLEDSDIQTICSHVSALQDCYKMLLKECDTYWQLDRYMRLMNALQHTYNHLCANTTANMRDLLTTTKCFTKADDDGLIKNCTDLGFSWTYTWREILRLQVSPQDRCSLLDRYKACLIERLTGVLCGEETTKVLGSLLDIWLVHWCNKDVSSEKGLEYLYQPVSLKNWLHFFV